MKAILVLTLTMGLSSCVGPMTAAGPAVRDESGMTIRHERLGGKKHLITVSDTRPGFGRVQDSYQSMTVVAHRYAARTCPGGYRMEETGEVNSSRPLIANNPTKTFVFTEKP